MSSHSEEPVDWQVRPAVDLLAVRLVRMTASEALCCGGPRRDPHPGGFEDRAGPGLTPDGTTVSETPTVA